MCDLKQDSKLVLPSIYLLALENRPEKYAVNRVARFAKNCQFWCQGRANGKAFPKWTKSYFLKHIKFLFEMSKKLILSLDNNCF